MNPLLQVENLTVNYQVSERNDWPWTPPKALTAVNQVSLEVRERETLGVVGESGSGKTTLARAIVGTAPISSGRILWNGTDLATLDLETRRRVRKEMPMVFQDPLAALNPRMTVGQIIAEPLRTHEPQLDNSEVKSRVRNQMERVGLLPNLANRYPHEFSGGQCQRIGIARALILKPKLVICDEPVAALDVSVRAQVVNLLQDLQREYGLAMIVIAHDMSIIKHISTRILVMYVGQTMEVAPARKLVTQPHHPYTKALISSVPVPDPIEERVRPRTILKGELPSPLNPPDGCVFESRCPQARQDCRKLRPELQSLTNDHLVACPYHDGSQNYVN